MRIVIVWNEQTDYAREVREWLSEFRRTVSDEMVESLDPETREGSDFAQAYDIVEYPSILALESNGKVLQMWRGTPLPQIDQVAYWATAE